MQQARIPLAQIIIRYDALLQRYARRLVKDQAIAAAIVKRAFEQVYDVNSFDTDSKTLRSMFIGYTYRIASLWLLVQSNPDPQNVNHAHPLQ
jgi:DNA-directed RNA polymerase specialized sigma24 family protein